MHLVEKPRRVHVILLAGGTGSRFGEERPKQFSELLGQPVLSYSLRRFSAWMDGLDSSAMGFTRGTVVLISHAQFRDAAEDLARQCCPEGLRNLVLADGGATRHLSSVNGVRAVAGSSAAWGPCDVFLIHDTARPYVPLADLDALLPIFSAPEKDELAAASLVSPSSETLVEGEKGHLFRALDRSRVYAVKTPQALSGKYVDRFLAEPDRPEFTDLLRWAEVCGLAAALVVGSPLNLKLTTQDDRVLLEAVLRRVEEEP